jgi:Rieske Fe-S protein
MLPEIGAVTVRLPSVPTEVKDEESTFAANVVPVKVPASDVAVMLIFEVPLNATPLIVLGVARAVAVAALPVTLPEIGAVTVRLPSVPTEVKDEESTLAASVLPVKVAASDVAVMLMFEVPLNATPLIVLGVANAVAVAALPVTLPEIGAVTVRLPSVPTEVKDEESTFAASVLPVNVAASDVAVMLILEVPLNATPLIVLGVASAVAVAALPVTLPEIGAVTVRLPSVPTEVKDEESTFAASVLPVKVAASDVAVMLILEVPLNATPLIVLGVANAVAVAALPVTLPEIGAVTVRLPSVPTEVRDEESTLAASVLPVKVAASDVAVMLIFEVPLNATPLIVLGVAKAVAVAALPVTLPEIGAVTVSPLKVPTEVMAG